jgi:hypothetical protein
MGFKKGERVRHPNKPEWGIGEVLEDTKGDTVNIFFVGSGEKVLKPSSFSLSRVEGPEAAHPVLDNLRPGPKFKSLSLLVANFKRVFPVGFQGDAYHRNERDYKVKAHDLMASSLGKIGFGALVDNEDFAEICKRALAVVNQTNLIFPNEKMSLKDGLKSAAGATLFSVKLYALLYDDQPMSQRFDAFADCLSELHASKWTTATYFLFMRFPEQHMFLKPEVTRKAADACGFELNYRPEPNWFTYSKLLALSQYLFESLAELKPRDMIDIQSFIWSTERIAEGEYAVR